ncbi:hypothetical protein HPP92_007285 [Vanilla planifolia]|uniref:Reverse transcriptase zinc-binding domain-containing protein n=1 Tax=Vanilla planifolia TaxID=51239 RepID=A0A835RQW4_VANPL|nr:hypothetical protein HPP92_007285 [Vanilla planifolia]
MAAACRMWWNYLYSDSLWVNMIKSMTHGRVNDNSSYCYGSTVWKRMMKLKKVLMDKMGSTTIQFEDLIGELSHQGKFNLSKAYEVVRTKASKFKEAKFIWNRRIPSKMSILLWRMLNDALPFSMVLKRIGYNLASKCQFCGNEETVDHVFMNCQHAIDIWDQLENRFGITLSHKSKPFYRIQEWWKKGKSVIGEAALIIPAITCWEIWKRWNAATREESVISINSICELIILQFRNIKRAFPNDKHWRSSISTIQLNIQTTTCNTEFIQFFDGLSIGVSY